MTVMNKLTVGIAPQVHRLSLLAGGSYTVVALRAGQLEGVVQPLKVEECETVVYCMQ